MWPSLTLFVTLILLRTSDFILSPRLVLYQNVRREPPFVKILVGLGTKLIRPRRINFLRFLRRYVSLPLLALIQNLIGDACVCENYELEGGRYVIGAKRYPSAGFSLMGL